MRGGERCLEMFLRLYPEADVFTLLHVRGSTSPLIDARVKRTSFVQWLPFSKHYYRALLPLYPAAAASLSLDGYNLVISLSHAAAKNVTVPRAIPHVCYCFSPMRYIWDQAQHYFGRGLPAAWPLIKSLRHWDLEGARGVDEFVGISYFVAARIRCYYRRLAEVIYPPVETSWITPRKEGEQGSAFLYAGALVPYKRVDVVVEAFNRLGWPLWIVGTGSEAKKLKKQARANITFVGRVKDDELAQYYRNCRALVFPGTEDFGMIPVECLAAGRPVVGAFSGGLAESVAGMRPWTNDYEIEPRNATGVFMNPYCKNPVEALIGALRVFVEHEGEYTSAACVERSGCFSPDQFITAWESFLRRKGLAAFALKRRESKYAQAKASVV